MNRFFIFLFLVTMMHLPVIGQQTDTMNYKVFYYESAVKSSEGYIINGKPNAYWKNYYENGQLKSEGNRKDFELDSTWKFYNEKGKLTLIINYKQGKKDGLKVTYNENEKISENFVGDVKQGQTLIYYPNGKVRIESNFVNGREYGFTKEFAEDDGRVITLIEYNGGFIKNKEIINRYNGQKNKNGLWKTFYPNGLVKTEEQYFNGKKDGYFKEFDLKGNLISIKKYLNDVLQEDAKETAKLDVRIDYWDNGNIKIYATYKDTIPQGIRREYLIDGKIEKAITFESGIKTGDGIVDEAGLKQGDWKEYYENGKISAEGKYSNGKRIGKWIFYYRNGSIEQIGYYNKNGLATGDWKWLYTNGNLLREESYENGREDGFIKEYDINGGIITEGEYVDGNEEGLWKYKVGDEFIEGSYKEGMRNGIWKEFYSDGKLFFEGNYFEDNPDGRHVYYWDNGNIREEGNYIGYKKNGEWKQYTEDGVLFISINYKDDEEIKFDGIKIMPEEIER